MTDQGELMLSAIRQLRDLHRSVSLLLKTADAEMAKHDWTNAKKDATALHEMSYSIDSPDRWMPREVFRYYKNSYHPRILASISVLLDDSEGRLAEPLLSAALFDFRNAQRASSFSNWLASIYKAIPGREADGEFMEISRPQLEQSWQADFEKVWCFAHPLGNVTSESFLRKDVVEKLIAKAGSLTLGAS